MTTAALIVRLLSLKALPLSRHPPFFAFLDALPFFDRFGFLLRFLLVLFELFLFFGRQFAALSPFHFLEFGFGFGLVCAFVFLRLAPRCFDFGGFAVTARGRLFAFAVQRFDFPLDLRLVLGIGCLLLPMRRSVFS